MPDAIAFSIPNLPKLLIDAIRVGTWQTPNSGEIRILARAVRQAQTIELDCTGPLVVLACRAQADLPVPNTDWTPEMIVLHDLIWPFLASSMALSCTFERDHAPCRTLAEATVAVRTWTQSQVDAIEMTEEECSRILRDALTRVSAEYPQLGLSYGYIGNIWHGPYHDDRSFRYFTKIAHRDDPTCSRNSVHFGGCGIDRLKIFAQSVDRGALDRWAADAVAKLETGAYVARRCAQPEPSMRNPYRIAA